MITTTATASSDSASASTGSSIASRSVANGGAGIAGIEKMAGNRAVVVIAPGEEGQG